MLPDGWNMTQPPNCIIKRWHSSEASNSWSAWLGTLHRLSCFCSSGGCYLFLGEHPRVSRYFLLFFCYWLSSKPNPCQSTSLQKFLLTTPISIQERRPYELGLWGEHWALLTSSRFCNCQNVRESSPVAPIVCSDSMPLQGLFSSKDGLTCRCVFVLATAMHNPWKLYNCIVRGCGIGCLSITNT